MQNLDRIMEVSSIGIPLSHPLHLCSLPPINGLLSHQSILMIVEGPKLDMMPIVLRSIIFLLKFIYLSLDNIKFFIDAAKLKCFHLRILRLVLETQCIKECMGEIEGSMDRALITLLWHPSYSN